MRILIGLAPSGIVSREMERRIPTAARLTTSDDPPSLTNGQRHAREGQQVRRRRAMLMNAWNASHAVMPSASRAPNVSGARERHADAAPGRGAANRPMTVRPPTRPSSWPTIAKMKSFAAVRHGAGRRHAGLWPRPWPEQPPERQSERSLDRLVALVGRDLPRVEERLQRSIW